MATLVLGGIGAGIGSLVSPLGAQWGWNIGVILGGLLDYTMNAPHYDRNKLEDLRISGSSYGLDVPMVWGVAKLGVNTIWVAMDDKGNHLVEHRSGSGGGSGGPSVTTYSYTTSLVCAVCVGSLYCPDGTVIHRNPQLTRLMADDVVIWDNTKDWPITLRWKEGEEDQAVDTFVSSSQSAHPTKYATGSTACAFPGIAYLIIEGLDLSDFSNRIPNLVAEVATDSVALSDILGDLSRVCGLTPTVDYDYSAASGISVYGFAVSSNTQASDAIMTLLQCYMADIAEVDGRLVCVLRGGADTVTVDADDLGAAEDGQTNDKVIVTRTPTNELPGAIELTYFSTDATKHLEQFMQRDRRQTSSYLNQESLNVGLALPDVWAKKVASYSLDQLWSARERVTFYLGPRYLGISAGDPVVVPINGVNKRIRVTEINLGDNFLLECQGVYDSLRDVTQVGRYVAPPPGSGTGGGSMEMVPSDFDVWSGTELTLNDQLYPGFYVVATGADGWSGADIYMSADGGSTYALVGYVGAKSVMGATTNTLASGSTHDAWDNTNTVAVELLQDGELSSTADVNVEMGQNSILVGNEILGLGTATLTSAQHYTLSHMIRGRRNSPMTGHTSSDRFVLLSENAVRINVPDSYVGETLKVKVVSRYDTIGDVTAKDVVIASRTPLPMEEDLATHEDLIASATVLGHIKIGDRLTIDPVTGVLDADVQTSDNTTPFWRVCGFGAGYGAGYGPLDQTQFDDPASGYTNRFWSQYCGGPGGTVQMYGPDFAIVMWMRVKVVNANGTDTDFHVYIPWVDDTLSLVNEPEDVATGTVAVSGTAVTGTDTSFDTDFAVDDYIKVVLSGSTSGIYRISAITDATHMTLQYDTGLSVTGKTYKICPSVAFYDAAESNAEDYLTGTILASSTHTLHVFYSNGTGNSALALMLDVFEVSGLSWADADA